MKRLYQKIILVLIVAAVMSGSAARGENVSVDVVRPKVGLVLSGGGAKGFAHIGALKVIDRTGIKIDYITGTSMGAIIGALYAMGYTPAQIESFALSQNWLELFDDAATRRYLPMGEKDRPGSYSMVFPVKKGRPNMPSGLISGQKLQSLLFRLFWPAFEMDDFKKLPIPFNCVATDLETGQSVPLSSGCLPEAVRASMSIPTVFAPIEVNGRWMIDGGVLDNFPAEQAADMGAEVLIGVDVSARLRSREQLSSLVDVLDQTISFQSYASVSKQRERCLVLITPELAEYTPANFNRVAEIIERGEKAALGSLPRLQRVMDSLGLAREENRPPAGPVPESLYVAGVKVEGLNRVSKQLVLDQLDLPKSGWVTADFMDEAIERVYSTQFFEKASYRLRSVNDGNVLVVDIIEKSMQVLGLGLRYDSNTNAEILAGFCLRNFLGHSSLFASDLRLGEDPELRISEAIHAGLGLGGRATLTVSRYPLYLYQQSDRWASLRYRTFGGEFFLGTIYSKAMELGSSIGLEYYRATSDVAPVDFENVSGRLLILDLHLKIDTYDRRDFPTKGQKLLISQKMASAKLGGGADFYRKLGIWQGCYPISKKFSLSHQAFWGNVSGREIPLHCRFYAGGLDQRRGSISLAGLKPMELNGNNIIGAGIGAQFEMLPGRFIDFNWIAAKAVEGNWEGQFETRDLISGVSFGGGVLTPVGPFRVDLMGGSRHAFLVHLRLGCNF